MTRNRTRLRSSTCLDSVRAELERRQRVLGALPSLEAAEMLLGCATDVNAGWEAGSRYLRPRHFRERGNAGLPVGVRAGSS